MRLSPRTVMLVICGFVVLEVALGMALSTAAWEMIRLLPVVGLVAFWLVSTWLRSRSRVLAPEKTPETPYPQASPEPRPPAQLPVNAPPGFVLPEKRGGLLGGKGN